VRQSRWIDAELAAATRLTTGALRDAEASSGRTLTRNEILRLVAKYMKEYRIPMNFTTWGGK
jgi:hypothetical protein